MTIINPSSISGITSITLPSGDGNVLTIHTNDGTERFRIDSSGNVKVGSACTISPDGDVFFTGVTTATTFTGAHSGSGANLTSLPAAQVTGTLPAISGANLTNLTAGNLTGALPAISGANLTGIAATDNVRTGILDVAGIATFRDNVNVPNINGGQIGGRRNIIINGAMMVAQRGGGGSTSNGFNSLDRFGVYFTGVDENPTQYQSNVASGTTPYTEGFRHALAIQNGNQTSGAGAGDYIYISYKVESRDMANSGWNYTSTSSFITLSFWIKSSVAQTFYGYLKTADGTGQGYRFETGALSADTWTKVTKTIPGNSNIQFDTDSATNKAAMGMELVIAPWFGTNYTAQTSDTPLGEWFAYSSGATRMRDMTSTWYTTNDATFEITGVQLELGSQAPPFEHRSFSEELTLCQRYCYICASSKHNSSGEYEIEFIPANMRATPTATRLSGVYFGGESSTSFSSVQTLTTSQSSEIVTLVYVIINSSDANCGGKYRFDAEM